MKKNLAILLLILQFTAFNQISGRISDISFLDNCLGTKEKFIINGNEQLQLQDASASGTSNQAYVSFASESIDNAVWELYVKINATTSSSNYARYYLVSDHSDLSDNLNGYYVMIGNTTDEVSLYRQSGSTKIKIIDGVDKRVDFPVVEVYVKVTRDQDGNWELYSKLASESDFYLEGTCTDLGIYQSFYSGIYVNYSSGNKDKYFFDHWVIAGDKYVKPYDVNIDDVIFNELMVKPTPAVGLPEYEYIELYNRTDQKFNLSGFHLADGSKKYIIENAIIQPHAYLLICAESKVKEFEVYGTCSGMNSFPGLTDSGKFLWLEDSDGNIISWVEYSDKWYQDNFRSGGGWSLECIDADNLSNDAGNWHASTDSRGGTPCEVNSVARYNPDILNPEVIKTAVLPENSIEIFFSEPMNIDALADESNYEANNHIVNIKVQLPQAKSVRLFFEKPFIESIIYEIGLRNITDKAGNNLLNNVVRFAIPEKTEPLDIVINEVLFNASADGAKYVELYNRSDKTLDLSDLIITTRKNDELASGSLLSPAGMLFFPHEYVVLTSDVDAVCEQYYCSEAARKIKLGSFPSYSQATGTVVLVTRNAQIIDEFSYTEKMHHSMVKNKKGVSLERINPNEYTQDPSNWHSASFDCGYGTPGYQNSQYLDDMYLKNKTVWVEPETFTPDNDGIDDVLNIYYSVGQNGYTATVAIYDAAGNRVRKLANNVLLSTEGTLRWNGENDNGQVCNIGIYILYMELVHINGHVKKYKLPCVLL